MPGIERSSPRCCTTSVCPTATTARMAAKGSIDTIAARDRLPEAMSGLTANRTIVAIQMPEKRPNVTRKAALPKRASCRSGTHDRDLDRLFRILAELEGRRRLADREVVGLDG